MDQLNCIKCNKMFERHKLVVCCICKKVTCSNCAQLSLAEIRKANAKGGLTWSCEGCGELGDDINGLKAAILALREEIANIKTEGTSLETNPFVMEEIIQEISNRERRKTNIVIYNIPENGTTKKDQITSDTLVVAEIFAEMDIPVDVIEPMRLGKYDPSRGEHKRPIKVALPDVDSVRKSVKSARRLRDVERFKNYIISMDKTPFQSKLYRLAAQDLDSRIRAGERDLRIKYLNGIPKVVSVSEN